MDTKIECLEKRLLGFTWTGSTCSWFDDGDEDLRVLLTIFIDSEVHHLPRVLSQRLDDSGESVSPPWLLQTVLGAATGPYPAQTPH